MSKSVAAQATYSDIQALVLKRHKRTLKTCWIAHVKEQHGLPLRQASNRQSPESRVHPCPEHVKPLIEEAMRELGMLQTND